MLVLSRKTDERIQIGSDIFITVLGIKGGRVRLGLEAPRNVRISRDDLQICVPENTENLPADYVMYETAS